MIGKRLRSLRALVRYCQPYAVEHGFLHTYDHGLCFFTAIKTNNDVILTNYRINFASDKFSQIFATDKQLQKVMDKYSIYGYRYIILPNNLVKNELDSCVFGITVLGPDFLKEYNEFFSVNQKLVDKISYAGFDEDTKKYVYAITEGSKNLIEWICNVHAKTGIRTTTFAQLLQWRDEYQEQCKKLSRGSITAYTKLDQVMNLREEMSVIRRERRANESASKFNTMQKKMLRDIISEPDTVNVLNKFHLLTNAKQMNFIKKVSSIDDIHELVRQLRHVTADHFKWTKEDFMDYLSNVEGLKYDIVYESDSIVVLTIGDYETIKQIAKTTNWCISKNKYYWDSYMHSEGATQYIMLDFSKKEDDNLSIIGFTTGKRVGITNAHDFTNNNMMPARSDDENNCHLNRYYCAHAIENDIYAVLTAAKIDFNIFMKGESLPYEWSRSGVMNHILKHVHKDNIKIIMDADNKLVLSIEEDSGVAYILGSQYTQKIGSLYQTLKHLLFFNFNRSPFLASSVIVAIIDEDDTGCETCFYLDDRSFSSRGYQFERILCDYGLPFDTIKRPVNKKELLGKSILSWTYEPSMSEGMTKEDISNVLMTMMNSETFYRLLDRSICTYISFDYLDLLYSHGIRLIDTIGSDYTRHFIHNLASKAFVSANRLKGGEFSKIDWITEADAEKLYSKKCENVDEASYIICCLAFETVLNHELPRNDRGSYIIQDALKFVQEYISKSAADGKVGSMLLKMRDLMREHLDGPISDRVAKLLSDIEATLHICGIEVPASKH